MLCSKCGQSLAPAPVEGGDGPSVVLMTAGARPIPLRCGGCGKIVCHTCQSETIRVAEGVTAANVSLVCPGCHDRLEIVRGAPPPTGDTSPLQTTPLSDEQRRTLLRDARAINPSPAVSETAPMTDARRKELLDEAKALRLAEAPRASPPGLQRLLDGAKPPPSKPVFGGCLAIFVTGAGGLIGYNAPPGTNYVGLAVGAVGGLVVGAVLELIADSVAKWFDRR